MTPGKRALDLAVSVLLLVVLSPLIALIAVAILALEGRPVLYVSERMRSPTEGFHLYKFRTMRATGEAGGVTGGDKAARVSRIGRLLRRTRADELPQLWNVLRGDISLVGPRPPLRQYVESHPALYAEVLQSRPGITGLASLVYAGAEERLLARCRTAAETDATYRRRCIPRKAKLDLLYQRNRSVCFDLVLIARTALRPFGRH